MATANTKCNNVTNLDATPAAMNDKRLMGGILKEQVGTVEIAAGDDNDSVYRVGRVHSSWRISNIIRYNDAITSGTDFDVGLYDIAATNSGAVINVNAFADAVSLASASVTGTNDLYEAGSDVGVEDIEQKVWEMAGLASDPNKWMDVCYTGVTVGSGDGTLSVKIQYVDGD
ncbi:MAG: hypothetical protein FJ189_00390 [Gammaproteobacteria bacterium]|nr:hypothetical protein [Gammaproteobacteria bacterium]